MSSLDGLPRLSGFALSSLDGLLRFSGFTLSSLDGLPRLSGFALSSLDGLPRLSGFALSSLNFSPRSSSFPLSSLNGLPRPSGFVRLANFSTMLLVEGCSFVGSKETINLFDINLFDGSVLLWLIVSREGSTGSITSTVFSSFTITSE